MVGLCSIVRIPPGPCHSGTVRRRFTSESSESSVECSSCTATSMPPPSNPQPLGGRVLPRGQVGQLAWSPCHRLRAHRDSPSLPRTLPAPLLSNASDRHGCPQVLQGHLGRRTLRRRPQCRRPQCRLPLRRGPMRRGPMRRRRRAAAAPSPRRRRRAEPPPPAITEPLPSPPPLLQSAAQSRLPCRLPLRRRPMRRRRRAEPPPPAVTEPPPSSPPSHCPRRRRCCRRRCCRRHRCARRLAPRPCHRVEKPRRAVFRAAFRCAAVRCAAFRCAAVTAPSRRRLPSPSRRPRRRRATALADTAGRVLACAGARPAQQPDGVGGRRRRLRISPCERRPSAPPHAPPRLPVAPHRAYDRVPRPHCRTRRDVRRSAVGRGSRSNPTV